MVLHGVYLACIALFLLVIMILLVILWRMRRRPGEQDEHFMQSAFYISYECERHFRLEVRLGKTL